MKHAVTCLLLLMLSVGAVAERAQAVVYFTARRHVSTYYTETDLSSALEDVNGRLKLDNERCNDHPCSATFLRSGTIDVFGSSGDGLDVIDNEAELDEVLAQPDRIKVVTAVDYCSDTYNPSFIGCGLCDDFGFVVESNVAGDTYVHEYGHNINLHDCDHREDCQWNIMYHASDGTNDAVNPEECVGFGGQPNTVLSGEVYDGSGGPLTTADSPYWVTGDVEVPTGRTLTIEPGVEIQFKHDHKITSFGFLTADGTISRIHIFSNSPDDPRGEIDGPLTMENGGELRME